MIAGDVPAVDAAQLDRLIDSLTDDLELVIVPDRHGTGTNAMLLTPADLIAPAFGEGSRERHEQLGRAAGAQVRVVEDRSLALDVDTAADLAALSSELDGADRSVAPFTRAAIERLGPR